MSFRFWLNSIIDFLIIDHWYRMITEFGHGQQNLARQCGRLKANVCFAYHGSGSNSVNQGKILLESVASIFFQSYVPTERFSTSNISSAIGGITSTVRPPQTFMLSTNSSTMKTTKVKKYTYSVFN